MQNDLFEMPVMGRKTDTSAAAADDMQSKVSALRKKVLEAIKTAVMTGGLTSRELSLHLNIPYESVQPRTSELKRMGLICDSGFRRRSRAADKQAIVWRAV